MKYIRKIGILLYFAVYYWPLAVFVGMFFDKSFPILRSVESWTFRIYLGAFWVGIIGLTTLSPGFVVAKEIYEVALDWHASRLETRLTVAWSVISGLSFSILAGAIACLLFPVLSNAGPSLQLFSYFESLPVLSLFRPLAETEAWIISLCGSLLAALILALCWIFFMSLWIGIGCLGRWIIRNIIKPADDLYSSRMEKMIREMRKGVIAYKAWCERDYKDR